MIDKLHFITQETPTITHAESAARACQAGVKWVQLRMKNKSEDERRTLALETLDVCRRYGAKLIINDYVALAEEIGADGVHLGQNDMCPHEARTCLSSHMLVGGTANTFEQVRELAQKRIDYLGVGPFRFTETKQQLSPILGDDGYRRILENCKAVAIDIPIIAIGGIRIEDVEALKKIGVYGVALASAINHSANPEQVVEAVYERLYDLEEK